MNRLSLILISMFVTGGVLAESTLTDEQANAMGMTPIEDLFMVQSSETLGDPSSIKYSTDLNNFRFEDSHLDLAEVVVLINKSVRTLSNPDGQTIKIYQNGIFVRMHNTSTGTEKLKETTSGRKYIATTPLGIFRPKRAFKEYQSKAFFGSRMDYAIFFIGGIATHSTSRASYAKLGMRASGGCARMIFEEAMDLNTLMRSTGEGHDNLWDLDFEGLERNQYSDRIKLPNISRFSGRKQPEKIWTYDTAIIVTL